MNTDTMDTLPEEISMETTIDTAVVQSEASTSIRWIETADQWTALQLTWQEAFPDAMQSFVWLKSWWEHLGQPTGAKLTILQQHLSQSDWFAPLMTERGSLGLTVKFLGSGTACSDYLALGKASPDDLASAKQFAETMCEAIVESSFPGQGRIDCLEWEGHAKGHPVQEELDRLLVARGWKKEEVPLEGCWVTTLPDDWNQYELSVSKSRRRKIRKAFKWQDSGKVALRWIDSAKDFDAFWPEVVRLHQDRRVMLGQAGCFADDRFQAFLTQAVKALVAEGKACLAGLEDKNNQRIVAVTVLFCGVNQWQVYQSGADAGAMDLEPGHSLNALVLKRAFDQGVRNVDFLRGDEPYKEGWGADRIGLYRTRWFNTHLTARLRYEALRLRRQWKQWTASLGQADPKETNDEK